MQWKDFEQVQKFNYLSYKGPRITLLKRGQFNFNQATYDLLGKPETIVLLFDPKHRAVGLKGSTKDVEHSYPLTKGVRSGYTICVMALSKHKHIDLSKTRRFDAHIVSGVLVEGNLVDGVLVFNLEESTRPEGSQYNFEEFKSKAVSAPSRDLRVTIRKDGDLTFNRATHQALGEPETVTLWYSKKYQAIGLRSGEANEQDSNTYPVRRTSGYTYTVTTQRLMKTYDIRLNQSLTVKPYVLKDGLICELDKGKKLETKRRHGSFKAEFDDILKSYQAYFNKHRAYPTLQEFVVDLGITRQTLYNYLRKRLNRRKVSITDLRRLASET